MSESKFTSSEISLSSSNVLRKLQSPALGIGGIALAASVVGAMSTPKAFFAAWLVAFLFWLGMALGSTALLMMQYISGGRWGAAIRRPLEAGASNVPLMALAFLPLAVGFKYLYPWADPDQVAASVVLQHKAVYLEPTLVLGRAVLFFAIWSVLSYRLVSLSRQSDTEGWGESRATAVSKVAHAGILLWGVSMSLAAVDWAMSLEPVWFSHIYPLMFTGAQILGAFTLAIMVSARVADHKPVSTVISSDRFHDVGKLLLAFTMIWAYFQLSQWIIMWGANLPEEVEWYVVRNENGYEYLTLFLFLFHFVVPFALLLSQTRKKKPMSIAAVATLIFVMRFVDLYWWVTPSIYKDHFPLNPLYLTTWLGIGGIWMWRYIGTLSSHPVIAVHDPVVEAELEHA